MSPLWQISHRQRACETTGQFRSRRWGKWKEFCLMLSALSSVSAAIGWRRHNPPAFRPLLAESLKDGQAQQYDCYPNHLTPGTRLSQLLSQPAVLWAMLVNRPSCCPAFLPFYTWSSVAAFTSLRPLISSIPTWPQTKKFQRPSNLFASCKTETPNHSLENRNRRKHLFSGFQGPPTSLLSSPCNPLFRSLSPLPQLISSWKERAILYGFHWKMA